MSDRTHQRTGWASRRNLLRSPAAVALAIIIVWEAGSRIGLLDPIVLPAPSSVAEDIGRFLTASFFWAALANTLGAAFLGLMIGGAIGIAMGVFFSLWPLGHQAGMPLVIGYEFTPKSALAPVFVAWLGFGLNSKVAVAAAICFFPLLVNTMAAFRNADADLVSMMRVLGANKLQALRVLYVPSSIPVLVSGLRVAASLALIGAIVAEFVVGGSGIGGLILDYTWAIDVPAVFALIATLGGIGLVVYWLLGILERRLAPWASTNDTRAASQATG